MVWIRGLWWMFIRWSLRTYVRRKGITAWFGSTCSQNKFDGMEDKGCQTASIPAVCPWAGCAKTITHVLYTECQAVPQNRFENSLIITSIKIQRGRNQCAMFSLRVEAETDFLQCGTIESLLNPTFWEQDYMHNSSSSEIIFIFLCWQLQHWLKDPHIR